MTSANFSSERNAGSDFWSRRFCNRFCLYKFTSSAGKVAWMLMSAISATRFGSFSERPFPITVSASGPAIAVTVPPRSSASSEICRAVRVVVPDFSNSATASASPGVCLGSNLDPAWKFRRAVTSGKRSSCTKTTAMPFGSLDS